MSVGTDAGVGRRERWEPVWPLGLTRAGVSMGSGSVPAWALSADAGDGRALVLGAGALGIGCYERGGTRAVNARVLSVTLACVRGAGARVLALDTLVLAGEWL